MRYPPTISGTSATPRAIAPETDIRFALKAWGDEPPIFALNAR